MPESLTDSRRGGRGGWIENRPTSGLVVLPSLAELAAYREVVLFLALRQLQVRYKQTYVGIGWTVLQPLAAATLFTFVFDRLISVPADGVPYIVFAFSGLAAWMYFSGALGAGTGARASAGLNSPSAVGRMSMRRSWKACRVERWPIDTMVVSGSFSNSIL